MRKNLDDECIICFEINNNKEYILLECCDKYIHKSCIDKWLVAENFERNKSCIYCTKSNIYIENFIKNFTNLNTSIDLQTENNIISIPYNNLNFIYKYKKIFLILVITTGIFIALAIKLSNELNKKK